VSRQLLNISTDGDSTTVACCGGEKEAQDWVRKDYWRPASVFTESVGPEAYPRTASVGRGCLWPERADLRGLGRAACRDGLILSLQEDPFFV